VLIVLILAALVIGVGIGLFLGRRRWRGRLHPYPVNRLNAASLQAEQARKGGVLILGDSLAEHLHFDDPDILNAGSAFAKVSHIADRAPEIIDKMQPAAVVLVAGTNDSIAMNGNFPAEYRKLVDRISGRKLVLVGVGSSEDANATISATAADVGAAFVPPLPADLTYDGVHHTLAGREEMKRRILASL
jgi:uncharacterized protein YneF (UPF0154 family)